VHFGQVGITENSQAVVVEIVADALANIEYDLADSENYFKGSTSLKASAVLVDAANAQTPSSPSSTYMSYTTDHLYADDDYTQGADYYMGSSTSARFLFDASVMSSGTYDLYILFSVGVHATMNDTYANAKMQLDGFFITASVLESATMEKCGDIQVGSPDFGDDDGEYHSIDQGSFDGFPYRRLAVGAPLILPTKKIPVIQQQLTTAPKKTTAEALAKLDKSILVDEVLHLQGKLDKILLAVEDALVN